MYEGGTMETSALRAVMMLAFILAFVAGSLAGAVIPVGSEPLSGLQLGGALAVWVLVVGGVSVLESRHVWHRYGGTGMRQIVRRGRKAGGNVQPLSAGFGAGVMCGWFWATHVALGLA